MSTYTVKFETFSEWGYPVDGTLDVEASSEADACEKANVWLESNYGEGVIVSVKES